MSDDEVRAVLAGLVAGAVLVTLVAVAVYRLSIRPKEGP